MTIIVKRQARVNAFALSKDVQERARKHLLSVGIPEKAFAPIVWPDDAVSAYRENMYDPWKFVTKADIRREKINQMNRNLERKRNYGLVQRRAVYVWVFFCPGVNDFIFRGWWIYVKGIKGIYRGGGYKGEVDGRLLGDLLKLFPLAQPGLFETNWNEWKKEFVKKYQRGDWRGKPQGKALVWAEIEGDSIKRLSR